MVEISMGLTKELKLGILQRISITALDPLLKFRIEEIKDCNNKVSYCEMVKENFLLFHFISECWIVSLNK